MKNKKDKKSYQLYSMVGGILFYVMFCFIPANAQAAAPKYVYIMSADAVVVKYDNAAGKVVEEFYLLDKQELADYLPMPEREYYWEVEWFLSKSGFHYDAQNRLLYLYVPYSKSLSSDEKNSIIRQPALLKIQLPDWTLVKGINFIDDVSEYSLNIYTSPDMKKIFRRYSDDVTVQTIEVYDATTLNKMNSYSGITKWIDPSGLRFANDGTTAYYRDIFDPIYKYVMTGGGITMTDINDTLRDSVLLPSGKWDQIREKYGILEPGSDEKVAYRSVKLTKSLLREEHILGLTGKAALIYTDITKFAIHGVIIEDIPVKAADTYLSDDGTRAYVTEFVEVLDGDRVLSRKLTGNIYI